MQNHSAQLHNSTLGLTETMSESGASLTSPRFRKVWLTDELRERIWQFGWRYFKLRS